MQDKSTRRTNQSRTEATRAALVAAARRLFVEKGYGETGTPEIVREAAVTRGALYHHFADKAALLRAVLEAEAQAVAEAIDAETAGRDGTGDALRVGARAYFRAMAEPGRARLLLVEGPAALGSAAMAAIDRTAGGASLKAGLAAAMPGSAMPETAHLDALADIVSAAFDRAALAVAEGAPSEAYEAAAVMLLERLAAGAGQGEER